MSLFSLIGAALLACVLAFGGGFYKGDQYGKRKVQAEWDAQKSKDRQAIDDANIAAQAAAELYEEAKASQRVRTVTVTREVTRALETASAWRDAAIPDGVRGSLAAAASAADTRKPDGPMPAASAAGAQDERGSGAGLRAGPGWARRLFGSASSPG